MLNSYLRPRDPQWLVRQRLRRVDVVDLADAVVAATVAIAAFTNSISAVWAKGESKLSIYLICLIVLSPFVFISFGLVTEKVGLVVSSGLIDSLLTISSMLIGLIVFREWSKLTFWQYLGVILAVIGIVLMVFFASDRASDGNADTVVEAKNERVPVAEAPERDDGVLDKAGP